MSGRRERMSAVAWLLEDADPAVRAKALVSLAGRSEDDPEVRAARRASLTRGSVARLLDGLFVPEDNDTLYAPKYVAPYHRLIALADMGAPGDDPRIAAALDRTMALRAKPDGGFGRKASHLCITGNLVRAATRLGRGDDPRVRRGVQWLVDHQLPNGAWTCFPEEDPEGTLDCWEPLAAFAALPEKERPMEAVRRGLAYYLDRDLGLDEDYAPWRRIHFPRHYYYDALVGLELATTLGDSRDPRLRPALEWLRAKRRPDGRWALDAQHPDIGASSDYTPTDAATAARFGPVRPLEVEPTGSSRWATLLALTVLRRVEA